MNIQKFNNTINRKTIPEDLDTTQELLFFLSNLKEIPLPPEKIKFLINYSFINIKEISTNNGTAHTPLSLALLVPKLPKKEILDLFCKHFNFSPDNPYNLEPLNNLLEHQEKPNQMILKNIFQKSISIYPNSSKVLFNKLEKTKSLANINSQTIDNIIFLAKIEAKTNKPQNKIPLFLTDLISNNINLKDETFLKIIKLAKPSNEVLTDLIEHMFANNYQLKSNFWIEILKQFKKDLEYNNLFYLAITKQAKLPEDTVNFLFTKINPITFLKDTHNLLETILISKIQLKKTILSNNQIQKITDIIFDTNKTLNIPPFKESVSIFFLKAIMYDNPFTTEQTNLIFKIIDPEKIPQNHQDLYSDFKQIMSTYEKLNKTIIKNKSKPNKTIKL
jgi:hypothetical protein